MTWGHHMRRDARRLRRYGVEPMMFMSPGDRLPETAAVIIARLAWRYRSELAPVSLALIIVAAGWLLHAERPHWSPVIAAATAMVAVVLGAAGRRLGLASR